MPINLANKIGKDRVRIYPENFSKFNQNHFESKHSDVATGDNTWFYSEKLENQQ